MTTFTFKPATRENVGLLIGLAAGTGGGKTFSAMELATGIAGDRPFCVIDTEARRALHYADRFRFDHGELRAPFRPAAYEEAISAADAAGYPVIVVDSASHEHAGDGGLLDWHEELLDKWAGDDWKKREANNMRAWIEPKMAHKHYVQKLLQIRAHLILCFRAEEKVEMAKEDGKMVIRPKVSPVGADGWMPVCEKNLPYEMTCSFLLKAARPGYPIPIKLQEQHRALFPLDKPINRATGEAIARWAKGFPLASLSEVLAAIERAEDTYALEAVKTLASQLDNEDKAQARDAFKKQHNKINGKPKKDDEEKQLAEAAREAEEKDRR